MWNLLLFNILKLWVQVCPVIPHPRVYEILPSGIAIFVRLHIMSLNNEIFLRLGRFCIKKITKKTCDYSPSLTLIWQANTHKNKKPCNIGTYIVTCNTNAMLISLIIPLVLIASWWCFASDLFQSWNETTLSALGQRQTFINWQILVPHSEIFYCFRKIHQVFELVSEIHVYCPSLHQNWILTNECPSRNYPCTFLWKSLFANGLI